MRIKDSISGYIETLIGICLNNLTNCYFNNDQHAAQNYKYFRLVLSKTRKHTLRLFFHLNYHLPWNRV